MVKHKFKYISIVLVLVFGALVSAQSSKKFVLDEIDFPIVAKATSLSGKPIYYRGEQSLSHVGNYHPTLYIHSLAVFISIFGYNESVVRYFGLICTLISLYLVVRISIDLGFKNKEYYIPIIVSLYLLHPYTIANTTLPDIDSTLLPVTLTLFVYISIRKFYLRKARANWMNTLPLAIIFALNLWTKLTTPLILIPFLFFLLVIMRHDFLDSVLKTIWVSLMGALIFIVTFALYCNLVGLSFNYTMSFLVQSFVKGSSGSGGIINKIISNLANGKEFIQWLTPPYLTLLAMSVINLFKQKKNKRTLIVTLVSAMAIFTSIFYLGLISPFGGFFKYPYAVFPLVMTPIAYAISSHNTKKVSALIIAISSIAAFQISNIYIKDIPFFNPLAYVDTSLAAISLATVFYFLLQRKISVASVIMLMFTIGISIGYSFQVSRTQALAEYPTKYHYGLKGFEEVVRFLKENTKDNEVIWSMKDVGYYVNNRYEENYGYFFDPTYQSKLKELINSKKINYYVATTGIGQDRIDVYTQIKEILEQNLPNKKIFYNYVIYY